MKKHRIVCKIILFWMMLSFAAIADAQNGGVAADRSVKKLTHISLKLSHHGGEALKINVREANMATYRMAGNAFCLIPILRDERRGAVEVRVFRISQDQGQEVFREIGSVVADKVSKNFSGDNLPFNIELDGITNSAVATTKNAPQSHCNSFYCEAGEMCSLCGSDHECDPLCMEMCGIPIR